MRYPAELQSAEFYRERLYCDILPFWLDNGFDSTEGGFFTGLDASGRLLESDKAVWFQGRAAWTCATCYGLDPKGNERLLEAAIRTIEFSDTHCYDPSDGRMYFRVTRDGNPLIKRRYLFSEYFAMIAKSAVGSASGDSQYHKEAVELWSRVQIIQADPMQQKPKFNQESRPSISLAGPMIEINVLQQLRDSARALRIEDLAYDTLIKDRIDHIERYFVRDELSCVLEQCGPAGEYYRDHFEGRLVNPGHSIEAAWFILKEAKELLIKDPQESQRLTRLGTKILLWSLALGWDEQFGGILYFKDSEGLPPYEYWHSMKFWWPHNEAIIACLYAYSLTNETIYSSWLDKLHAWSFTHFPDPAGNEWFGYLNRDGSLSNSLKGSMFKGPFHVPRMYMNLWRLL